MALKKLNQNDFKMRIIRDIGNLCYLSTKKSYRAGEFECLRCKNGFVTAVADAKKSKTGRCQSCKIKTVDRRNNPLYSIWINIKTRCNNPNTESFNRYGGRGISICKEWENNFLTFEKWCNNNGYGSNLTIDRINNNGNYEPSNCRWVGSEIQNRNKVVIQKNNTSGYKGVSFNNTKKRWIATICVNKKHITLGSFHNAKDGAICYNEYVINNNLEHNLNSI